MKILIIRNYPSYFDVEKRTYNIQELGLAKALIRAGYVCDIIFWTDKEEKNVFIPVDDDKKICIYYRKGKTFLKNTVFTNIDDILKNYDILEPCEYNQIESWYLAKKYPGKTIIYHGPYYSSFNKRYNMMCKLFDLLFLKTYIRNNTQFLAKSNMALDFLKSKGIKDKNIVVSGVGVDIEMLSNSTNQCLEPMYLQLKKDCNKLKLLYIGRFEKRRNLFFLIDVFYNVYKNNKNARLYLIGTGYTKYINKVFSYINKLGIGEYVFYQETMEQKELSNVYNLADYFLLPTKYEIFGMVLLEAMYYKSVVLTTKNGGSNMLIKDSENGYVFDRFNAKEWADLILRTYSDKTNLDKIKSNAHKFIKENYTWDKLINKFEEQYKKLI